MAAKKNRLFYQCFPNVLHHQVLFCNFISSPPCHKFFLFMFKKNLAREKIFYFFHFAPDKNLIIIFPLNKIFFSYFFLQQQLKTIPLAIPQRCSCWWDSKLTTKIILFFCVFHSILRNYLSIIIKAFKMSRRKENFDSENFRLCK